MRNVSAQFNPPTLMFSTSRSVPSLTKFFAAVALFSFAFSAFGDPAVGVLDQTDVRVQSVIAAQDEVTPALMRRPEILGTAVGVSENGNPTLTIYVNRDTPNVEQAVRTLPREVRGTPVQVELMDEVRAMGNTAKQTPPISLGTSGGWTYDLANGYCCGGTLGALVRIGSTLYVLSACHVLEGDTVLGGNNRIAQTGDPVIQPGLIDEQCNRNLPQTVGTLLKKRSLATSNTDCAIATVVGGMVRTDGAILGIGTISHNTAAASLNQHVKKSGRTSGLTHSHISGLNATVRVAFTNECNGGTYYKNFSGQIVVANSSSSFLKAGDSGSLMVEDTSPNPRAIGLLFAANNTQAFANPIGQVLSFLGATMVGN
jgi:hypothetical protein